MIAKDRDNTDSEAHRARKLPREVKALGVVILLNDTASEIIVPLLPAFLISTLGLGPAFLGIIEGIAESTASLLKFVSGWWSDRIRKRKPLAVGGYLLSNLLRPLIGLATAGWHVLFCRFFDRVGKGIRTAPRDALLASAASEDKRGTAFGFQRALDHAGAVLGPILASGFLLVNPDNLRLLFLLSVIPGLAAVLVLLFGVRERVPSAPAESAGRVRLQPPRGPFRGYLAALFLFTLGNSSDTFLVLRAQELGMSIALAPILWIVLHVSRTAWSFWGGGLSDRWGRKQAIALGWAVYALSYFLFALADAAWHMWALFFLYGLYTGLTEGPERALVADLSREGGRGGAFGWYHLVVGAAALPASLATGLLWKYYGAPVAFFVGAALSMAAMAVLLLSMRGRGQTVN